MTTPSDGQSTRSSATPSATSPAIPTGANPWAAKIYNDAIARGKDHPMPHRILARAWLGVTWRCWQDETVYNHQHRALQALLNTAEAA